MRKQTRQPRTRKKEVEKAKPRSGKLAASLVEVALDVQADADYYAYGVSVIEDRAIFGSIDGLKPVIRRALWATKELGLTSRAKADKAAKVVGNTIGNYHPHGDTAAYGAIVTAANSPLKLIHGEGNWGTMSDPPAAYRYTNCKLSKAADAIFFDSFYLPVVEYVPNYDGSRKEPLVLPTLLPNTILNGNFGIAPGVNTRTPSYTLSSVIKVARRSIKEKGCTPELCLGLDFLSTYGGVVHKNKEVKKSLLDFYKTGKGKVRFDSVASQPNTKNEIRIDRFAPISNLEKTLGKVVDIKGVIGTRDDGDKTDRYKIAYVIQFNRNLKGSIRDGVLAKVMKEFSADVTFSVQSTERYVNDKGEGAARLFPCTVPQLINLWIDYRVNLERKACSYWIAKRKLEIDDLNLLRLAVKMRDVILKALTKNCSDQALAEYLAKQLKITVEQANRILDLKVRQLRSLEDKKLVDKIKAIQEESAGYEDRKKRPRAYIVSQLTKLEKDLASEQPI